MEAPSAHRPVTTSIGVVWTFQLDTQQIKPPRFSIAVCFVILARTIVGWVYFKDCPQQPNIPNYLLGLALAQLVHFIILSDAAESHQRPSCFKACLHFLVGLSTLTWILAGNVWVFSVYQPNYDPADGRYCNKTLYTFAFWNAVWETLALLLFLGKLCKGLLCYVVMRPAPIHRDMNESV